MTTRNARSFTRIALTYIAAKLSAWGFEIDVPMLEKLLDALIPILLMLWSAWENKRDAAKLAAAEAAFSHASGAFLTLMQAIAERMGGGEIAESSAINAEFDFSLLREQLIPALPMLIKMDPTLLTDAIDAGAEMPDMLTASIVAVINRGIYRELGANTDAMQTAYIAKTGITMILTDIIVSCNKGILRAPLVSSNNIYTLTQCSFCQNTPPRRFGARFRGCH